MFRAPRARGNLFFSIGKKCSRFSCVCVSILCTALQQRAVRLPHEPLAASLAPRRHTCQQGACKPGTEVLIALSLLFCIRSAALYARTHTHTHTHEIHCRRSSRHRLFPGGMPKSEKSYPRTSCDFYLSARIHSVLKLCQPVYPSNQSAGSLRVCSSAGSRFVSGSE